MNQLPFFVVVLISCFASVAWGNQEPTKEQSVSLSESGHILITPDSPFSNRLKLTSVLAVPKEARELRTVGQMIAMANPSGGLHENRISWVELDPDLSQSMGLSLKSLTGARVGDAYGMTYISTGYLDQIRVGQKINIARYGLKKSTISGSIFSIGKVGGGKISGEKVRDQKAKGQNEKGSRDQLQVLFKLKDGHDWYVGTNCEVDFPLVKSHPVRIPTTALLHEGLGEYVIKEVAPGEFVPEEVTIVGELAGSVQVIGDLSPRVRIVGEGAILLKPLIRLALSEKGGGYHAP